MRYLINGQNWDFCSSGEDKSIADFTVQSLQKQGFLTHVEKRTPKDWDNKTKRYENGLPVYEVYFR